MVIKDDVSHLPRATEKQARPPSSHPIVVNVLAEAWYQKYLDDQRDIYAPAIPTLPYRLSLTGNRCDRQLYYNLTGVEPTNPPTIADAWRFELGHYIGDGIAEFLGSLGQGWFSEWIIDLRGIGIEGSGHADVVNMVCTTCGSGMQIAEGIEWTSHPDMHHFDTERGYHVDILGNPLLVCPDCKDVDVPWEHRCEYVVEVKSIGGFKWKKAATNFKGAAEGPGSGHVLQAAIGALALDCEKIIVAYFSVENVSPDLAKQYTADELGRFAGEWHFTVSANRHLVDDEIKRIQRLLVFTDPKVTVLPAREINDPEFPIGATIINPKHKGHWVVRNADNEVTQTGSCWMCAYCSHVDRCQSEGESDGQGADEPF